MGLAEILFGTFTDKELKRIRPLGQKVQALGERFAAMSDSELQGMTPVFRQRLADGETLDDILPEAFAAASEAAVRVLGQRPFPGQILGGIALHRGDIAEMKTGEGKTLAATMPVYLNALTGDGVHVVTVNDYLARRDSEWMGKIYRYLGLTVGLVVHGLTKEERRAAYACDVTYGTNNEFGFDYLRDNMVVYKKDMSQRGHNFAIVDEVDSILIDEARTPLIISGPAEKSTDMYQRADQFARTLKIFRIAETDTKEDNDVVDGDYIVEEKQRSATLTKSGIEKAERYFNVENLADSSNMELLHHINQAIKARGVMRRDVDYVVKDGEVIIVDEFTGRLMLGRRYNEGLHQAIEAKEGVQVARESKTLATITFQNYFRMYTKLAGMTGTALTEANEFSEIYGLNVVSIPTNKPVIRQDMNDLVYKTEAGKFRAVIANVVERHATGQPVLVGTISIEKSELLSRMLSRQGIKHNVLNAKYHDREAEIVAQAGKLGAVTIATNMAGRGTDIVLGGNAEAAAKADMRKAGFTDEDIEEGTIRGDTTDAHALECRAEFTRLEAKHKAEMAAEGDRVRAVGGLCILGTERHESRRIDNQLRGRAGRQGDPGASQFYLSLEDDLMRLFGGERVQGIMDSLKVDEDMPIEAKMISAVVENAQKKIEGRNFSSRKNVLDFDDVMNNMRETIYAQRAKVLSGEDVSQSVHAMVRDSIESNAAMYLTGETPEEWNIAGLRSHYLGWLTDEADFHFTPEQLAALTTEDVSKTLIDRAEAIYAAKEAKYGPEVMREVERVILLQTVDRHWMNHIDDMDQLRRGMSLRSYGQHNPVVEYRIEGYEMFDAMVESIKEDTTHMLLAVDIKGAQPVRRQMATPTKEALSNLSAGGDGTVRKMPVRVQKVGRNDPCPCGSGLKYKKCHGKNA